MTASDEKWKMEYEKFIKEAAKSKDDEQDRSK